MNSERGRRWRDLLDAVALAVGDPWRVTGRGLRSCLTMVPVDWTLRQILYNPGSGNSGRIAIRDLDLTAPVNPLKITEEQNGHWDQTGQRWFDPTSVDAFKILETFVSGPAAEYFDSHTSSRSVLGGEKAFLVAEQRPYRWPKVAGWRIITESQSPLPIIDKALLIGQRESWTDSEISFWSEFRKFATSEDRDASLLLLDRERRRTLKAAGIPEQFIADMTKSANPSQR